MRRSLVTSLLPALALAAGSCRPADRATRAEPPRSRAANRIVVGMQQEPDKLNTMLNSMVAGTYINQTVHGYFAKYDDTMELVPELITEIPTVENGGISPDGLTVSYRLRDGVRWHDGTPFTSADVSFTAEAILDPRHEMESRLPYDRIARVETPDPLTVVFHLREPYAPFVSELLVTNHLMPRHLLAEHVGTEFSKAPQHRAPVGVGPFRFDEWVTGSHLTVVRNDDYFRGPPGLDAITFRFIPDVNSLYLAFQAGEIDLLDNAEPDKHDRLRGMPGVDVHVTPALMWEHLDMNLEDPILSDRSVRQAVQLAIDREEISEQVYGGHWPPAHGDVSPSLPWFNPEVERIVRHDPEQARRLLDDAGWRVGEDGIRAKEGRRLTLSVSTTAGRQLRELTEQVLQQHLARVGIELEIENHNATAFFAPHESNGVLKRGRFQLGMYAWITSPDPTRHSLYHSSQIPPPSGQNHPRYSSERMDALLEEGLRTIDPVRRKAIYDEVQAVLARDVPMTPLVWRADIDATTSRFRNYRPNPTQIGDTWNAWEWALAD